MKLECGFSEKKVKKKDEKKLHCAAFTSVFSFSFVSFLVLLISSFLVQFLSGLASGGMCLVLPQQADTSAAGQVTRERWAWLDQEEGF